MSSALDLELNPKFVFISPRLPEAASQPLAEHVDRAIIALGGRAPIAGERSIEVLRPVDEADAVRVELWVSELDDYTCTYAFLCSSDDGRIPYARGERTVVNLDPHTHRPAKWDAGIRSLQAALRKDLRAYS